MIIIKLCLRHTDQLGKSYEQNQQIKKYRQNQQQQKKKTKEQIKTEQKPK